MYHLTSTTNDRDITPKKLAAKKAAALNSSDGCIACKCNPEYG